MTLKRKVTLFYAVKGKVRVEVPDLRPEDAQRRAAELVALVHALLGFGNAPPEARPEAWEPGRGAHRSWIFGGDLFVISITRQD